MSLWNQVRNLEINMSWYTQFPVSVRSTLANWLEVNARIHPQLFLTSIISELKAKSQVWTIPSFIREELTQAAVHFEKMYGNDPAVLQRILIDILQKEFNLAQRQHVQVQQLENTNVFYFPEPAAAELHNQNQPDNNNTLLVNVKLGLMKFEADKCDQIIRKMEETKQKIAIIISTEQQVEMRISESVLYNNTIPGWTISPQQDEFDGIMQINYEIQAAELESELAEKNQEFQKLKTQFYTGFSNLLAELSSLRNSIVNNNLAIWQFENIKLGLRSEEEKVLNSQLQNIILWMQQFATIIFHIRQQVLKMEELENSIIGSRAQPNNFDMGDSSDPILWNARKHVTNLIFQLIQDQFIVEIQPSQIIKTYAKTFGLMRVRNLLGDILSAHLGIRIHPIIKLDIILESEAKLLVTGQRMVQDLKLSGNLGYEVEKKSGKEYKWFDDFAMTGIKDLLRDKGMDSKFAIVCRTACTLDGTNFEIWALSVATSVISNLSQESVAWANIVWNNMFSTVNPYQFEAPIQATWDQISPMLNSKLLAEIGQGLTAGSLIFLKEKLFGGSSPKNVYVTWAEFSKSHLQEHKFTFVDWFCGAVKLILKMQEPWRNGYIHGFIGKAQAETLLAGSLPGTFVLRFSESILGAITATFVLSSGGVVSMQLFTLKCFESKTLADLIDVPELGSVYPNTAKKIAFGEVPYPTTNLKPGYVGTKEQKRIITPSWSPDQIVGLCSPFFRSVPSFSGCSPIANGSMDNRNNENPEDEEFPDVFLTK